MLGHIGNAASHGNIFPLFTLLEDFGYLPRVAFNLDHGFRKMRYLRQTGSHDVYGLRV